MFLDTLEILIIFTSSTSANVSQFAPAKYSLIHFHRKHCSIPLPFGRTDSPALFQWVEVRPTTVLRYLGVRFDHHLTGSKHVDCCRERAASLMAALSSIAGSTWGVSLLHLRRMYTAVLWPQIAYGCSAWYARGGYGFQGAETNATKTIESIQRQALYRIAGGFRTTSRAALEVCLHIPPAMIALARTAEETCLRILTSPLRASLHSIHQSGRRPAAKALKPYRSKVEIGLWGAVRQPPAA